MPRYQVSKALIRLFAGLFAVLLWTASLDAARLTLQDGRVLEGTVATLSGVAEELGESNDPIGPVNVKSIVVVDDGLRRTYVPKRRVREINEAASTPQEKIYVRQSVANAGGRIGAVGPIAKITPFDEFGRRVFTMRGSDGNLDVLQGITEVTPTYTRVDSLKSERSFLWEMRVATSSIPRDTLSKVLHGAINPRRPDDRLKLVRLYVQAERYRDARLELESIMQDFPDLENKFAPQLRSLRQMGSRRLLEEIEMRASAGQHRFVLALLRSFPVEGVAGETLQKVREIQADYRARNERGNGVLKQMQKQLEALQDSALRKEVQKAYDEIVAELNYTTLGRMAAFERLVDDEDLSASQKLALAVSGWLLGSDAAVPQLPVALSLYRVRDLVQQYLGEPSPIKQEQILEQLAAEEASSVAQIAGLLAHMKPPMPPSPKADNDEQPQAGDDAQQEDNRQQAGSRQFTIAGYGEDPQVDYLVQLPPEYDPYRLYPVVVTLNGTGTTPQQQIDWWAGSPRPGGQRMGQATRHGYIVIAVQWRRPNQRTYDYSAREHFAVLSSLRDACRRFSIDTDRVFLSGHSLGGAAAWDIGLAHPDLWAGVIPIVAVSDMYCAFYWRNADHLPFYIVAGELDGDKMVRNSRDLDRYLRYGYDTTVVEFLGRGHEHFQDEVQRLMEWMNLRRRDFFPSEFEVTTMRKSDNYFWWLEFSGFPSRAVVDPAQWPPQRGTRPLTIAGKVTKSTINVKTGTDRVSLWLSPELVDFDQRQTVVVNGRRILGRSYIEPSLSVLLEDARTRGDRQQPFWARIDAFDP